MTSDQPAAVVYTSIQFADLLQLLIMKERAHSQHCETLCKRYLSFPESSLPVGRNLKSCQTLNILYLQGNKVQALSKMFWCLFLKKATI